MSETSDLAERISALASSMDEFARELRLAWQYALPDAASSLTKSRVVLEKIVERAFREELGREPKRPLLSDMLRDHTFSRTIERRVLARMNAIRGLANLGAHGLEVEPRDAIRVLDDLCEVLTWYFERYGQAADAPSEARVEATGGATASGSTRTPAAPAPLAADQASEDAALSVSFISRSDGHEGELLAASFACYERLFPDPGERDDPIDIASWIDEARLNAALTPWREVFAVLHDRTNVVGVGFFTAHLERHLAFASYFGVEAGWRHGRQAEKFLEGIRAHLNDLDGALRALVFEVELPDFGLLARASEIGAIRGTPEEGEVLLHLRRLRRLNLYQMSGSLVFLDTFGVALPYIQPALTEDLSESGERQMLLMIRPMTTGQQVSLADALEFVYDDLYGDGYGASGPAAIEGFEPYLDRLKSRLLEHAAAGWRLGRIPLARSLRGLLALAKKEGLEERLKL